MIAFLFTTPSGAWPPISVLYIGNAASGGSLAPGSLINVQVTGATLKGLEEVPLTFTSSDGQKFIAMGIPRDAGNMTVIVPEEVPVGHTELSVNLDGQEIGAAVDIVEYAPALFSLDGDPYGPIKAADYYEQGAVLNGLTHSAVANQVLWIWATGLNGAEIDDVTVWVGDDPAVLEYVGSSGYAGVEQINFQVPPNPKLGCYVPIAIEVSHVRSDNLAVSINSQPGACAHPLGLSYAELIALDRAGWSGKAGGVNLGVLQFRYSYNDVGIDEWMHAGFGSTPLSDVFRFAGPQRPPSLAYGCRPQTPSENEQLNPAGVPGGLDAGGTVVLLGPEGRQIELKKDVDAGGVQSSYGADVLSSNPQMIAGGDWLMQIAGGDQVLPLQEPFHLPPPPMWDTPMDETIHLRRDAGNVIRWNPSGYALGELMAIGVDSLVCFAQAEWGQVVIPGDQLGPSNSPSLSMVVIPEPGGPKTFPIRIAPDVQIRGVLSYRLEGPYRSAVVE